MSVSKASLKVVAAHRLYILIYLMTLSLFGLLAGATQTGDSSDQVKQTTAGATVTGRDGSTIFRGVRDYVESVGEARPLEDPRQATQDVTAQNRINYTLTIPAGYEQRLQEATRQGTESSRMDMVIGYESVVGPLTNVRTDSYLGQVVDYPSTPIEDPARAVSLARGTMNHPVPTERVAQDVTPLPYGLIVYAKLSIYPIMAFAIVTISTLMALLGRQVVRSCLAAAPVSSRSRNFGAVGVCLVIGLVGQLWIFGLTVAAFGAGAVTTSAPLLRVVGVTLDTHVLVTASLGFLMGQFGPGQNAANAVTNVDGMVLSLLAGIWTSIKWMSDTIVRAARLTLGYWATQMISGAPTVASMFADVIDPLPANYRIRVLFAVAIFIVAMVVGRTRAWSSL